MRETSELYKRLLDNDAHVKESRLTIGGTVYEQSQIVSLSTSELLFAEDTMSIGGAVAREIEFAAFLDDSVPKRAQIIHEVRLVLGDEVSEWLQKGVYYIDTRSKDPLTGVTTVHGFDAMLMAEQEWIPPAKDKFPMDMKTAVELTAASLGLTIDPRTTFKTGDAYKVDYPVADADESEEQQALGLSIRQMWRWVAAAHGGNFIINDLGQLRLVPLNALPAETGYLVTETGSPITFGGVRILLSGNASGGDASQDKAFVGSRTAQTEEIPALEPISKIVLKVDNNNAYVSKSDTEGLTLEVDCAYGSKQMADDLLTQLQGYVYRPVQAEDALIDPAAELGDGVTIYGVYTILAQKDTLWDLLSAADIGAPGKAELESEFRFTSSTAETFQYQLAATRSLIAKNSESVQILVERTDGVEMQYAELSVSLSGISGRVEGVEGEFAAFLLDTDAFYVMDESGNRTAIRGSSIDVTTLNVQNINFSGVISFKELTDTEDLLDDVDTALGDADDALAAAKNAQDALGEITYTYKGKTYIDEDRIMAGSVIAGSLQGGSVGLLDSDGVERGTITLTKATSATEAVEISASGAMRLKSEGQWSALWMEAGGSDNSLAIRTVSDNGYHVVTSCRIVPASDGTEWVGTSYREFEGGYFGELYVNKTKVTSDRNKKHDIGYDLSAYDVLFDLLRPAVYKLNADASDRFCTGLIAQDVEEAVYQSGLTEKDFSAVVRNINENGTRYYLCYTEFIALLIDQVQKLKARVRELEVKA